MTKTARRPCTQWGLHARQEGLRGRRPVVLRSVDTVCRCLRWVSPLLNGRRHLSPQSSKSGGSFGRPSDLSRVLEDLSTVICCRDHRLGSVVIAPPPLSSRVHPEAWRECRVQQSRRRGGVEDQTPRAGAPADKPPQPPNQNATRLTCTTRTLHSPIWGDVLSSLGGHLSIETMRCSTVVCIAR